MTRIITVLLLLSLAINAYPQSSASFADSIRKRYKIPELAYAVVTADSVLEMQALGVRKINTTLKASLADRFRIGSNTKAITGFIAALLVKQGKISWDTRFFDLFPELRAGSKKEYHHLTLLNLLTFRTRLPKYTYTDPVPTKGQFIGDGAQQRYQFAKWFFDQPPVHTRDSVSFSNLGYVAAGLMLEKVTGRSYQQLVKDLGTQLDIIFDFGQPNQHDPLQTWGHDNALMPEGKKDDYKLDWLLAAGNINVTLPDYAKFIQLQLKGLQGLSDLLTQQQFDFLHYGSPQFAVGWFWETDEKGDQFSYNIGNPGTFLSAVYVYKASGKAYILFSNAQTEKADEGMTILFDELKRKYRR